jgi:hypothetical protein
MIIAHIPTLSGAAWNEFTLIKQNRMTEIATQNRLPLIALVQSVCRFSIITYSRLECFSHNNLKYSIKQAKYSKVLLYDQREEHPRAPLYSALQQQEEPTNQVQTFDCSANIRNVRLYDICQRPSASVSRWAATCEDGNRRDRRLRDPGWSRNAFFKVWIIGYPCIGRVYWHPSSATMGPEYQPAAHDIWTPTSAGTKIRY